MKRPGFFRHLFLLWWLRVAIGLNKGKAPNRVLAVVSFLASSAPALVLGRASYWLMVLPFVAKSPEWSQFILNLLCFVTSAVWCLWPVLSAGVDDHSELSRYAAFPISGIRLLVASSLASLFEPRAIVIYGPLVGACLGYASAHPPSQPVLAFGLFVLFLLLNAAWGRVGLHLVLNVLRQPRNAETIGGFFVVVLIACSFIPPVDTSWLNTVGQGLGALDLAVLANAARALGRVPPGFLGTGMLWLAEGRPVLALFAAVGLVAFGALGLAIAYRLLLRFHAQAGQAGSSTTTGEGNAFARTETRWSTVLVREALDLWRNPRARLLASVPFLLAILLKLISGRDLFVFLVGRTADAWILGALCLYGAVVIGSTFSQNMFGYDGHGLAVFLAAPMKLDEVLRAKNLVHGAGALAMAVLVSAFYGVYFRTAHWVDWACAMAAVLGLLPVLLCAGNFLSLYFPVKFHASLKRRDKLPFAASMLGVAAAGLGSAPFAWALKACRRTGAGWSQVGWLVLAAVLAWAIYLALLPLALRLLEQRREKVLLGVIRDA